MRPNRNRDDGKRCRCQACREKDPDGCSLKVAKGETVGAEFARIRRARWARLGLPIRGSR